MVIFSEDNYCCKYSAAILPDVNVEALVHISVSVIEWACYATQLPIVCSNIQFGIPPPSTNAIDPRQCINSSIFVGDPVLWPFPKWLERRTSRRYNRRCR
jgi:hypothetical protein